jgi:hypothetical protein
LYSRAEGLLTRFPVSLPLTRLRVHI